MSLTNARIIELDEISAINAGSYFVIYDIVSGVTYKIKVDLFVPQTNDQNFNWVSNYSYSEDEVATRGGKWWQSLQNDNVGNIPTEGVWWTELSKQTASGLVYHANGLYTESTVFVMKTIDGFDQLFRLASATRPYNSTNFLSEWAAGDWQIASERGYFVVNKTGHGWAVNTQLTFKSGAWNTFTTGDKKLGIVRQVIDANNVIVVAQGTLLVGLAGLTPGATYYAQADGTITTTSSDDIAFVALSATSALLLAGSGGGAAQNLSDVLGTGNDAGGLQIKNVANPTLAQDVATKAYADALVVGLWDDRGNHSAAGGAYPSTGGSGTGGAIMKGDIWTISTGGTLPTGQIVEAGDTVRALIDTPGNTQANWAIQQNNIGYTPENAANKGAASGYAALDASKNVLVGDGTAGDKDIIANNADTNKPRLRYNDTTNKWQLSNDGTTFNDIPTGSSGLSTRRAVFRFNSNLYTEHELSFRGIITSLSESLTAQISSVTYEVRLDSTSTWTSQANIAAVQTWVNANITGSEIAGTKFWIKCLATYGASSTGIAENVLIYTPS